MAEAAAFSSAPSLHGMGSAASGDCGSLSKMLLPPIGGKRKTPSELRMEQLKRLCADHDDERPAVSLADGNLKALRSSGLRKHETSKVPRFVDTRVADIYAATKPGDRPKFFAKDKQKDAPLFPQKIDGQKTVDVGVISTSVQNKSLENFQWKKAKEPIPADTATELHPSNLEIKGTGHNQKVESAHFSTFRDVTQISSGIKENPSVPTLDMVKAFKGMAAPRASNLIDGTVGTIAPSKSSQLSLNMDIQVKPQSLFIKGERLQLDLSLKTSIRFTSGVSFQRCQRVSNRDQFAGLQSFVRVVGGHGNNGLYTNTNKTDGELSRPSSLDVPFSKALHSWTHPQSILPASVLSALASSAAHGGVQEREFLSKRQRQWENSFCSLYYMFRDRQCDLFYVSTPQFLVMFIGGDFAGRDRKACNAYLTRSTRGLRALLQEQDISFSMPLCMTEVGTTTSEEIQELTEFEKAHPGQTRLVDSMIAVDNSPQSLLAFNGSKSIHGLYDFLLNHRFLLSSTTGADVPVLYSPVSFENAALVTPEVVCKQLQQAADVIYNQHMGESDHLEAAESALNLQFSLEIKGMVLPPWIIWRVCTTVQQFHPGNFEVSLGTDPLSSNLNIAQDSGIVVDAQPLEPSDDTVLKELKKLAISSEIKVGFIKHLKFSEGCYVAMLATV